MAALMQTWVRMDENLNRKGTQQKRGRGRKGGAWGGRNRKIKYEAWQGPSSREATKMGSCQIRLLRSMAR
jgi:hypothetical protein